MQLADIFWVSKKTVKEFELLNSVLPIKIQQCLSSFKTKRFSVFPDKLLEESLKSLFCLKMGPLAVISGKCSYPISKPQSDT